MLLEQLVRGSACCNSDQSQLPLRLSAALPSVFSLAVCELPVFLQSAERWGHEGYKAGRPEQETLPAALEATSGVILSLAETAAEFASLCPESADGTDTKGSPGPRGLTDGEDAPLRAGGDRG
jgi:hypothetical protein